MWPWLVAYLQCEILSRPFLSVSLSSVQRHVPFLLWYLFFLWPFQRSICPSNMGFPYHLELKSQHEINVANFKCSSKEHLCSKSLRTSQGHLGWKKKPGVHSCQVLPWSWCCPLTGTHSNEGGSSGSSSTGGRESDSSKSSEALGIEPQGHGTLLVLTH
jgi:hypothetical protein